MYYANIICKKRRNHLQNTHQQHEELENYKIYKITPIISQLDQQKNNKKSNALKFPSQKYENPEGTLDNRWPRFTSKGAKKGFQRVKPGGFLEDSAAKSRGVFFHEGNDESSSVGIISISLKDNDGSRE